MYYFTAFFLQTTTNVSHLQMKVHQEVDNPGLDVALVLVHRHLLPTVEDLQEAEVGLQGLIQGLVLVLIVCNPLLEIIHCLILKWWLEFVL